MRQKMKAVYLKLFLLLVIVFCWQTAALIHTGRDSLIKPEWKERNVWETPVCSSITTNCPRCDVEHIFDAGLQQVGMHFIPKETDLGSNGSLMRWSRMWGQPEVVFQEEQRRKKWRRQDGERSSIYLKKLWGTKPARGEKSCRLLPEEALQMSNSHSGIV